MSDLSELTVRLSMAIGDVRVAMFQDEREQAARAIRDAHAAWDAALAKIERGLGVDEYEPSLATKALPGIRPESPIGTLREEHERWERAREAFNSQRSRPLGLINCASEIREWRKQGARLVAALDGA